MAIAPEPYRTACLQVLYHATLDARVIGWSGTDKADAPTLARLADLISAVHNIPHLLNDWDRCDESKLRGFLRSYDDRWGDGGCRLLRVYDDCVARGATASAPAAEAAPAEAAVLRPHGLKVAILQPQIAPNTGNIARLCVATGAELHLVRPLGFILSDKELRRSAMDYWPRLRLTVHDDTPAFGAATAGQRAWYFSSKASRSIWSADFRDGDWLVFGSETRGIDEAILAANADRSLRIPQAADERCLNLSTAAGVALYEALRQAQAARG